MKHIFNILLIFVVLFILSCSRDWNNPFETDSDLSHPPAISNIELNGNHLELSLDYSYSDECTVLFERKRTTAFEPVSLLKLSASVFADTTLDMEQNYNLIYRLRIQKNGYTSDYSNEKPFSYVSNVLYAPSELTCSSIELQGVRLNWTDNSSKETGFKIEKNVNGSGFAEAADLPANTTTWLDAISGMPDPPQSIIYRIRAYNNNLNSAWMEQNVIYSGLGAPTNLHITNSHFWEFTIAWTRNSTIATGYQIEISKNGGVYTSLALVVATTQTYITELVENGTYTFRVKAVRNSDSSTYSNEVTQQISIVIPTEGLIAYYPFNGNANDESGNGHHGTVNGATAMEDRFGHIQKSYFFNGESDFIQIQNSADLNPARISISAWIWGDSGGGQRWPAIITKYGGNPHIGAYGLYCIRELDRGIHAGVFIDGTWHNYTTPEEPPLYEWHHIVMDYNGSRIRLLINGIESLNNSLTGTIQLNSSSVYIGCENDLDTLHEFFNGRIDDIRIYNRALTTAEIQALYHEGGWTGQSRRKK